MIKNIYVFTGIAILLVSYIIYTMIRSPKGERPESRDRETDL